MKPDIGATSTSRLVLSIKFIPLTSPNAPNTESIAKWASRLVGFGADWPNNSKLLTININNPNLLAGVGKGWLLDPRIKIIEIPNSNPSNNQTTVESSSIMASHSNAYIAPL